ncbi:MAG: hypothetical protein AAFQ52_06550 [Chloroflexota bacterium]
MVLAATAPNPDGTRSPYLIKKKELELLRAISNEEFEHVLTRELGPERVNQLDQRLQQMDEVSREQRQEQKAKKALKELNQSLREPETDQREQERKELHQQITQGIAQIYQEQYPERFIYTEKERALDEQAQRVLSELKITVDPPIVTNMALEDHKREQQANRDELNQVIEAIAKDRQLDHEILMDTEFTREQYDAPSQVIEKLSLDNPMAETNVTLNMPEKPKEPKPEPQIERQPDINMDISL